MDQRIVEFIRALRAAGVRISLAESQDALQGVEAIGVHRAEQFRAALKSALIKTAADQATFDDFYPLFFSSNQPPLHAVPQQLTAAEQQLLRQALEALEGKMAALQEIWRQLLEGRAFSHEQLQQLARQSGLNRADEMYQRGWFERRLSRQAGLPQLQKLLDMLMEQLEQLGMGAAAREELRELLEQNLAGLKGQIARYVGMTLAQQMAVKEPEPEPDLLDVPFQALSRQEIAQIRDEIRRLAARLRSRAALRQKKAKAGQPDPRRTLRANMRYGGVPLELRYRTRHKKPSLVLICDVSTSVRYCAEFLLTLIYELQDLVTRTYSFIFINDLVDISMAFKEHEPKEAVQRVLQENPPGYYNTDLGNSLRTFAAQHLHKVDQRTTLILLGDGRNNYNDPRLDIVQELQRRSRRLIWFCPEPRAQWGSGDSDMHHYAALADGVYIVNSLRDLAAAVDRILADG